MDCTYVSLINCVEDISFHIFLHGMYSKETSQVHEQFVLVKVFVIGTTISLLGL